MGSEYEIENDGPVWQNVLTGAVIGFLVGGAVALLLAPKSGEALRADLNDAVDDLKDKAEQIVEDLQVSSEELVNRSKSLIEQTRENLVRSVEAGKDAYAETRDDLTRQLENPTL